MIKERLISYLEFKGITKSFFEKSIRMGNGYINNVKSIGSDKLEDIINQYPDLNIEWLISGCGEMLKLEYNAGRDNNINTGNNKGVVGNSGTIGNMVSENSGNYVSMGDQKVKKLLKDGEIHIEMEQSAEIELLKQTNSYLEIRIKDLETLIGSKDKSYEEMKASKDQTIETYKLMVENFIMKKK